jgi:hypothetical protein
MSLQREVPRLEGQGWEFEDEWWGRERRVVMEESAVDSSWAWR